MKDPHYNSLFTLKRQQNYITSLKYNFKYSISVLNLTYVSNLSGALHKHTL